MTDRPKITPEFAAKLIAYRKKHEKYRYYVPNGKVQTFINLVGENKTFINLLSAANGVGKTAAGVNLLAHLFWYRPKSEFFQGELFKNFPYNKKGRIVSDPTTVGSTLVPELKKWFPQGRFTTDKVGKNYEYRWSTDTGFEFDIMSYDQAPKEFESATLGWVWFDEPPPEAVYKATVSRMRTGGIIIITMTPLTGSAYLYDQIVTNQEEGQRAVITADIEDNCVEHGERGILNHNDILRMVAEYNEEDKQARVFGRFMHLTGLVFKEFERRIHVVKPFKIDLTNWCVYQRFDCHPRNPDAVMWVAVNAKGDKYVIDELYGKWTTEELVYRILQKDAQYRVVSHKLDPSGFIVDQHTNTSLAKRITEISNFKLRYTPASKERSLAITRTHDALSFQLIANDLLKAPELRFFDTVERTIFELEHWQYNEYRGQVAERYNKSEKPQDKDDHMMENLGRVLIDEPSFTPLPRQGIMGTYNQNIIQGATPTLDPYD